MPRCLPPSSMGEAVITDSIIGDGCILDVILQNSSSNPSSHCVDQKLMSSFLYVNLGLIEQRCVIRGSVVGMRTRIADDVIVEDSIIIGSNIYEVNLVSWIAS